MVWVMVCIAWVVFLSTLSLRRATEKRLDRWPIVKFLSTLSLRRATATLEYTATSQTVFLSTLSLRRATTARRAVSTNAEISIHALLAESDPAVWTC